MEQYGWQFKSVCNDATGSLFGFSPLVVKSIQESVAVNRVPASYCRSDGPLGIFCHEMLLSSVFPARDLVTNAREPAQIPILRELDKTWGYAQEIDEKN